MNEKRTRQDTFYLEKVYDPVLLYPDGSVGELAEKNVDVKVRLPSRVEGRERIGTQSQRHLAEVALHASLEDYLKGRRGNTADQRPYRSSWRLADMPDETIAAYEAWRKGPQMLDLDRVRELAAAVVSSPQERELESMPCPQCQNTVSRQYACYTCDYARELYTYPLVRYRDKDGVVYDTPFDVAEVLRLSPKSLKYKTEWEIDNTGMMSAQRKIIFDVHKLPKEYVTGVAGGEDLTLSEADPLFKNIEIPVEKWSEDGKISILRPNSLRSSRLAVKSEVALTSEECLAELQRRLAPGSYHERKDGKDYNAMLQLLHEEVGRRGLELVFRSKYMGMGDSEKQLMFARRQSGYLQTQVIARAFSPEMALEDALKSIRTARD